MLSFVKKATRRKWLKELEVGGVMGRSVDGMDDVLFGVRPRSREHGHAVRIAATSPRLSSGAAQDRTQGAIPKAPCNCEEWGRCAWSAQHLRTPAQFAHSRGRKVWGCPIGLTFWDSPLRWWV
jgi:hypothetical protein